MAPKPFGYLKPMSTPEPGGGHPLSVPGPCSGLSIRAIPLASALRVRFDEVMGRKEPPDRDAVGDHQALSHFSIQFLEHLFGLFDERLKGVFREVQSLHELAVTSAVPARVGRRDRHDAEPSMQALLGASSAGRREERPWRDLGSSEFVEESSIKVGPDVGLVMPDGFFRSNRAFRRSRGAAYPAPFVSRVEAASGVQSKSVRAQEAFCRCLDDIGCDFYEMLWVCASNRARHD